MGADIYPRRKVSDGLITIAHMCSEQCASRLPASPLPGAGLGIFAKRSIRGKDMPAVMTPLQVRMGTLSPLGWGKGDRYDQYCPNWNHARMCFACRMYGCECMR